MTWVCLKCGENVSFSALVVESDKCFRCGWKRPKEEDNK